MKYLWLTLFVVYVSFGCTNENKYSIDSDDKYEKSKASLEENEKKHPPRFLRIAGTSKKNLLGQMVIKGNVYNNAKVVVFKDIEFKLRFYSKTGAVLEEDTDVIYETVHPGGTVSFKNKYFTPKGTDSVGFTVTNAKY